MQIEEIKAAVDAARERQARNSEWYAGSQWQKADAALIALWEMMHDPEATPFNGMVAKTEEGVYQFELTEESDV